MLIQYKDRPEGRRQKGEGRKEKAESREQRGFFRLS
jgi:hypothetical protein